MRLAIFILYTWFALIMGICIVQARKTNTYLTRPQVEAVVDSILNAREIYAYYDAEEMKALRAISEYHTTWIKQHESSAWWRHKLAAIEYFYDTWEE